MSARAVVLGGEAAPIGWWVTFIEAPLADVEDWLVHQWFNSQPVVVDDAGRYPDCFALLEPLESPWTKHLIVESSGWTMHLSNSLAGGDPTAPGPVISDQLGCRVVIAGHRQRHGPGHESTALWIHGPGGEAPLNVVRTLQVDCADGRWTWHESGEPLPFEQRARYQKRRKRDRFDRPLLLEYLRAFGLNPDEPEAFGASRVVCGEPTTGRTLSLAHARDELGLSVAGLQSG